MVFKWSWLAIFIQMNACTFWDVDFLIDPDVRNLSKASWFSGGNLHTHQSFERKCSLIPWPRVSNQKKFSVTSQRMALTLYAGISQPHRRHLLWIQRRTMDRIVRAEMGQRPEWASMAAININIRICLWGSQKWLPGCKRQNSLNDLDAPACGRCSFYIYLIN